jgi:hypothetical protein
MASLALSGTGAAAANNAVGVNKTGHRRVVVVARRTPQVRTDGRRVRSRVNTASPRFVDSQATAAEDVEGVSKSAQCPVSALLGRGKSNTSTKEVAQTQGPVRTPGPEAFSIASVVDVSKILIFGIQEAMLQYFNKYGPVCRFANPVDLNGAAGWLMVNDPDDIEHICAINVKNYTNRYLPDIYKWVTNEQGILGSQGTYNRKHRRLCQPTFRRPALLEDFADVISARYARDTRPKPLLH